MNIRNYLMATAILPALFTTGCSAAAVKEDRAVSATKAKTPQIYTFESDGNGFNTKNFFYDNGEDVYRRDLPKAFAS